MHRQPHPSPLSDPTGFGEERVLPHAPWGASNYRDQPRGRYPSRARQRSARARTDERKPPLGPRNGLCFPDYS
jgi:hypothetical protein